MAKGEWIRVMGCVCSQEQLESESPREKNARSRRASTSLLAETSPQAPKPKSTRQTGQIQVVEDVADRRKERVVTEGAEVAGRPTPIPQLQLGLVPKSIEGEQVAAGWPAWLAAVAGEAIKGWVPRRADSFEKLDKIGQGTYSNVYKARDLESQKLVALKKVRFDNLEPESVRFMAREIEVLRRLDHPNIVQLLGLVTSRMSCSLYLVFEYMEHDLAGLAACPNVTFTEAQVKCYMQQLLLGLEHCHTRGVLHRDIKGSNLLLDNKGILKIADFGLATFYRPEQNVPLTSRVVTLWYRPPELLLGATSYGVAVDLWSSGCILAELLAGKPIMPGRTEVEQLHKIFKLCGSPSEEYWRKSRLPHATIFKPTQPYKRSLSEMFKDFPSTSLALLETLLSIEPGDRGTATLALKSEFFTTKPLPCDPSSLPEYPPSKEYDAKLRDEEARRQRNQPGRSSRGGADHKRQTSSRERRGGPAPHANAEDPNAIAIMKARQINSATKKSQSEKFSTNELSGAFQVVGGETRDVSGQLQSRVQTDGRHPHASKSGPQPMLPGKGGGAGPSSGWGGKGANGSGEDVRNAPPRMTSRPGKSVTVPDFALQGGYPDVKQRLEAGGSGLTGAQNGGREHSRDHNGVKKTRERERERDGTREREREGGHGESRRERTLSSEHVM